MWEGGDTVNLTQNGVGGEGSRRIIVSICSDMRFGRIFKLNYMRMFNLNVLCNDNSVNSL